MTTKKPKERTLNDFYKFNLIELAKHHKKFCEGEECNISLIALLQVGEKIGITFSDEEKRLFV